MIKTLEALYITCLWVVFLASPIVASILTKFPAPYGRHVKKGWGKLGDSRVAWCVMEAPAFFVFLVTYLLGVSTSGNSGSLFPVFWLIHYFYRFAIYPFLQKSSKGMPVSVYVSAFIFNCSNGFINGYYLGWHYVPISSAYMAVGSVVFGVGFVTHVWSDFLLRKLRSNGRHYQIPHTFLFRWVCCPNYLGEIIQWIGFAIGVQSLPSLAFALFTLSNLVPRAKSHLNWYRETFPDFPKDRYALIPFVF